MADRARLPELPEAMANRALWARQTAAKKPQLVDIDHEYLPWVWCEEDQLWYSFDGNYSGKSPEEKRIYHEERQRKEQEWNEKQFLYAQKRYEQNLYWSKIRHDILERDGYTCQLCGKNGDTKLHIHHILKVNESGQDYYDNLITVCPTCHSQADRSLYNPDWR